MPVLNTHSPNFVPGIGGPPKHILEIVMPLVDEQAVSSWDGIRVGLGDPIRCLPSLEGSVPCTKGDA